MVLRIQISLLCLRATQFEGKISEMREKRWSCLPDSDVAQIFVSVKETVREVIFTVKWLHADFRAEHSLNAKKFI